MQKIVFLDAYSIGETPLDSIAALGSLASYADTAPSEVVERCANAQVVITNKVKLMRDQIDALPELKLICVAATGTNNVDVEYARSKGIEVKNVAGYSTASVAEATFSFVLALLRQIPYYNDFVQSGKYAVGTRCFNLDRSITEISGKRWGVIALGAIGRRVAQIATVFGAEVVYYSTSGKNMQGDYPCLSLDELLKTSDIVTIHAPLNDATRGLIGARELSLIKRTSILVNVGRGGIVDEAALAAALDGGVIAGAALDVFESEPIKSDNPLLNLKDQYKLIVAPHCGWSSEEARATLVAAIAENIKRSI